MPIDPHRLARVRAHFVAAAALVTAGCGGSSTPEHTINEPPHTINEPPPAINPPPSPPPSAAPSATPTVPASIHFNPPPPADKRPDPIHINTPKPPNTP